MSKLILGLMIVLLCAACSPEPGQVLVTEIVKEVQVEVTRLVEVVQEVEVTRQIEVEVTRIVQPPPEVIIATPTMPPLPEVFLELEGSGDTVSDNYEWGKCQKAVFYWSGIEGQSRGYFGVFLNKKDVEDDRVLVNEIFDEVTTGGEVLQPILGGVYWLSVEADGPWTIRGECQD